MKILICRPDHIGDMVYSTPIFRELKKKMPDCEITVVASPMNKPIIEKNPHVDKIFEIDIPKYSFKSIWDYFKMSRVLRKEEFDVGIDLRGSILNSFFLLKMAGVKKKISHTEYHPIIKHFLDVPLVFDKKEHIFEDNAAFLSEFGIKRHNNWPEIITTKTDEYEVEKVIQDNRLDEYICILPCAGLPEKQWGMHNFDVLIRVIMKNYPRYKIVLMGMEKDMPALKKLPHSCIITDMNVRQLPLLFKKSALVCAHDGGPMHSAWLMGAKTLALYPAEVADKFIPLKNCRTFQSKSKFNMNSITLGEVWKAMEEML